MATSVEGLADAPGPTRPRATATSAAGPAPEVVWPGRRQPTRTEQWAVGALAVVFAGYLGFLLAGVHWAVHPVLAALTALCGSAALGWGLAGARARRPRPVEGGSPWLSDLPRPTRRALRRQLRAGRPGPPELRSYAATWTRQGLQSPWSQAPLLATTALIAGGMAVEPTAPKPLGLIMLGLALALAVYSTTDWTLRRRAALQVADALDQLTPPPPHASTSADAS